MMEAAKRGEDFVLNVIWRDSAELDILSEKGHRMNVSGDI